jgi:hypothetical protein
MSIANSGGIWSIALKRIALRPLALTGLLTLAACGASEETTTIAGTTFTSDDEQGTATISSANGSLAVAEGDAAQKTPMPDYAPQYPGSTITNAMTSGKDGASKTTVLLTTTDPVSKVGAFYTDTFSRLGLELKQNVNSAEAVMLAAEAQAKKASVIIGTEGQLTTAVVTFSHN